MATLVPSTPICLFFNLAKLQCKQTVVTDFCIGFVNKIHIIGKDMIKETWIAKIKEIGCWTEELITFCPFSPVSTSYSLSDTIFWCWTFTQHPSFYLTSYVTDMNTHRCFFVYLYQPIHWYLTRILTFLSEQRAPFSTMFASRAFPIVIWSQYCNIQVSIFVTCLNFSGTGSRLWQLYVLWHDIWCLRHLAHS